MESSSKKTESDSYSGGTASHQAAEGFSVAESNLKNYNKNITLIRWLSVLIIIISLFVVCSRYLPQSVSHIGLPSGAYIEPMVYTTKAGSTVLISYRKDTLKNSPRFVLLSKDSGNYFTEISQNLINKGELKVLSISPNDSVLIVADAGGAIYLKGPADSLLQPVNFTNFKIINGICYKPNSTLLYIYGAADKLVEYNYLKQTTNLIKQDKDWEIISMSFDDAGKEVKAIVYFKETKVKRMLSEENLNQLMKIVVPVSVKEKKNKKSGLGPAQLNNVIKEAKVAKSLTDSIRPNIYQQDKFNQMKK